MSRGSKCAAADNEFLKLGFEMVSDMRMAVTFSGILAMAVGAEPSAAIGLADGTGLARAESALPALMEMVSSDQDCAMGQFASNRTSEALDFGGGVGGVIVQCMTGLDDWSRLFIVRPDANPEWVRLVQYEVDLESGYVAQKSTPRLNWDAEQRLLSSSIHHRATGCGTAAKWRFDHDADRIKLVEQAMLDCDQPVGEPLPPPRVIWPTNPPTPEPQAAQGDSTQAQDGHED